MRISIFGIILLIFKKLDRKLKMKIEIHNNTAIGSLEFHQDVKIPEEALTNIRYKLHNIEWYIWYDYEQDIVYMKLEGSIVSMMQFRKFILMNWPSALKE